MKVKQDKSAIRLFFKEKLKKKTLSMKRSRRELSIIIWLLIGLSIRITKLPSFLVLLLSSK